jgi:integrase/recombinase XerC
MYNSIMVLNAAIDEFLSHLRRRGYSSRTVDAYAFDLGKLAEYAVLTLKTPPEGLETSHITKSFIRRWIDQCILNGNTPRTLARKTASSKSLFKFLLEENIISENPIEGMPLPKIKKKPPKALSQDEIRQLISAPAPDDPNFLRDRAILALLYSTGMRVSELANLRIEQISLDMQTVRVEGKGARERLLPIPDSAKKALLNYLSDRERRDSNSVFPKSPAVVTPKNKAMTVRMIQYLVQKYGRAAGIQSHVHPHLLRHSIASHLIDEGCHIEAVRQTLGHEDLATTSIYLKTSTKFLENEHKKFNPSDRLLK